MEANSLENFIEFERKKHTEFFLPYYASKGWKVVCDNLGKNTDWDVQVLIDGLATTIDEKARQREYGDFLVEIVQDLVSGHRGWLFKPKDVYLYASWNNPTQREPSSLYEVNAKMLQDFILTNWESLIDKMGISEKGWGITLFTKINWEDLLFTKVAKRLI